MIKVLSSSGFKFLSIIWIVLLIACRGNVNETKSTNTDASFSAENSKRTSAKADVPENILKVLEYVEQNQRAPKGFVGGRTFKNRERRLPIKDSNGQNFKYREWDVNPKVPGRNRGTDRLITNNKGGAYYTLDHYNTFKQIK